MLMRQGFLKLAFADYEYGTGELFAYAETGGFAGRASAYFDIFRIEEFANALSEYPLPLRQRCSLASGFGPRAPEPLHEEHLSIEVYPIDSTGHIGVQVRMATPLWNDTRPDSQRTAKLELLTTYEPLGRFSRDLLAVIKGTAEEAVLDEEMIP
jgi:hypothetical protein